MKRKIINCCILLGLLLLSGCNKDKKIIGKYYLSYTDTPSDLSVYYELNDNHSMITVVPPKVIALGYNENCIIAAIHPWKSDYNPDIDTIYYYIIPIEKTVSRSPDLNRYGPLNVK